MKPIKIYNGRYTLHNNIASGGFATIYQATEEGQQEQVAIKVGINHKDPSYAASITKEAELLRRFDHQNVVKLRPIRRDNKTDISNARAIEFPGSPPFFVMEYLTGGRLEDYLDQVGALPPTEAASIALEVARALHHIHSQGFAHNDLKLENIVFRNPVQSEKPFEPVLVDFGTATRVTPPSAASLYITPPEQIPLVKRQIAPEFAENIDRKKGDVWGLGVVLYRMTGGQLPFPSRNEKTLTQMIEHTRPTSLQKISSQVSPELEEFIIDGCLAKKPEHRLSLSDVGAYLNSLGRGIVASQSAAPKKKAWLFGLK